MSLRARRNIAFELVNTLAAGKKPDVIPGIHFKYKDTIVESPESPMIPDLDALPFPAHDLQDRPLHQSTTADRRTRPARPQLYDSHQSRLPLQVYILFQAGHG